MYGLVKNQSTTPIGPYIIVYLLLKDHVWFGCPCMLGGGGPSSFEIIEWGGHTLF